MVGVKHGSTLWSTTLTDYGFASSGLSGALSVYNTTTAISNVTISNYGSTATSSDVEKMFVSTDNSTKAVSNITISHCLINGWQNAYWATSAGLAMNNWVFEYNICINGGGSETNHGEWINNNYGLMTNQIIRYNYFGSANGFTGCVVANNNDIQDPQIYGNVFDNYDSGNGVITGTSGGTIYRALIYNNTFLNCGVEWLGNTAHSGSVATNNLLYNMDASVQSGVTHTYNAYFSTTGTPTEATRQVGTGNPFVNSGARNFHLLTGTTAGYTLSSLYNTDPDAITRGSDGTWDRGAFEYGGSGGDVTAPVIDNLSPSGVQACTSNPRNVTLSLTTNENATARMSTTDIAYASMTDTFTTTGGTSHNEVKSLACGASYTYYVRTSDSSGNANTSSSIISFSIASPQIAGPGGLRITGGRLTH